jgi:hypothetical protein
MSSGNNERYSEKNKLAVGTSKFYETIEEEEDK